MDGADGKQDERATSITVTMETRERAYEGVGKWLGKTPPARAPTPFQNPSDIPLVYIGEISSQKRREKRTNSLTHLHTYVFSMLYII